MRILVTGGAGFIGHHLVDYLLRYYSYVEIVLIDRLDGSGNLNRLAEIGAGKNPRIRFIYHDLRAPVNDLLRSQLGEFDHIIHLAAATHVDRSIAYPMEFVQDNVVATCNLLEYARVAGCDKFIHFSTDEVFGAAPQGVLFKEDDRYHSSNPYSATKAGAEELAMAYYRTYGVPTIVTHTMNVCGIRQHPEKFIPGTIRKILDGETVTIHANKTAKVAGSRVYIDALDVSDAVQFLMTWGKAGEKYNIVGPEEVDNLTIATWIANAMSKPLKHKMVDGARPGNRPGLDIRYALDGSKMTAMGWKPTVPVEEAVSEIVQWSLKNQHWLGAPNDHSVR